MEFEGRSRPSLRLNLAPLIDVVLILLIFFMLTSTFVVAEAIDIDLPFSKSSQETEETQIVVLLSLDGQVALNDEVVGRDVLSERLTGLFEARPDRPATLKADADVSVQQLLEIMDLIREAGGRHVSIATESSESGFGKDDS